MKLKELIEELKSISSPENDIKDVRFIGDGCWYDVGSIIISDKTITLDWD